MIVETRYFQEAAPPEGGLSIRVNPSAASGASYTVPIPTEGWNQVGDDYTRVALRRIGPEAFQAVVFEGGAPQSWLLTEVMALPPLQFCPLRIQGPQRREFSLTVNLIALAHEQIATVVAGFRVPGLTCASSSRSRHSMLGLQTPARKAQAIQALHLVRPILETLDRLARTNWQLQSRLLTFAVETVPTILAQEAPVGR